MNGDGYGWLLIFYDITLFWRGGHPLAVSTLNDPPPPPPPPPQLPSKLPIKRHIVTGCLFHGSYSNQFRIGFSCDRWKNEDLIWCQDWWLFYSFRLVYENNWNLSDGNAKYLAKHFSFNCTLFLILIENSLFCNQTIIRWRLPNSSWISSIIDWIVLKLAFQKKEIIPIVVHFSRIIVENQKLVFEYFRGWRGGPFSFVVEYFQSLTKKIVMDCCRMA